MTRDEVVQRTLLCAMDANVKGVPLIIVYEQLSEKIPEVTKEIFMEAMEVMIDRKKQIEMAEQAFNKMEEGKDKEKASKQMETIRSTGTSGKTFH